LRSPKRSGELKTFQQVLGYPDHRIKAAANTRWLSIFYALERLWEQYPVLLLYFQCAGGEYAHIYDALRDIETSVGLVTLLPLLSQLNSLVKTTQRRDITLHEMNDTVERCRYDCSASGNFDSSMCCA
jgi:hypothetical protein